MKPNDASVKLPTNERPFSCAYHIRLGQKAVQLPGR